VTRPPSDVLRLVNNWVIYKTDEATIHPNPKESLWAQVRGLGQGQALVSFTHIRRPIIEAIDPSPAKLLMTRHPRLARCDLEFPAVTVGSEGRICPVAPRGPINGAA